MNKNGRVRLEVEELSARVLPSVAVVPKPVFAEAAVTITTSPKILTGTGSGTYTRDIRATYVDGPAVYTFSGNTEILGFGSARVTGTIHAGSMIPIANGSWKFVIGKDALTVRIDGKSPNHDFDSVTTLRYTVTWASGRLRGLLDQQGRFILRLKNSSATLNVPEVSQGTFQVTLAQNLLNGEGEGVYRSRGDQTKMSIQGDASLFSVGKVAVIGTLELPTNSTGITGGGIWTFTKGSSTARMVLTGRASSNRLFQTTIFQYEIVEATGVFAAFRNQTGTMLFHMTSAIVLLSFPSYASGSFRFDLTQNAVAGDARGTVIKTQPGNSGDRHQITGKADLINLGDVQLKGSIQAVGNVREGRALGTLTLRRGNSAVVLKLKGPVQFGLSPLPTMFEYTMISATGTFQKFKGHQGRLQIVLNFGTHVPPSLAGTFLAKFF